ncbi:hypothetical protein M885DRAFT_531297 [Pelagophyceae sp. CCMP2097]|nr:hypothetical protein M885DRAFT_531297 [Pelagophyceae sp. CCMP2097]
MGHTQMARLSLLAALFAASAGSTRARVPAVSSDDEYCDGEDDCLYDGDAASCYAASGETDIDDAALAVAREFVLQNGGYAHDESCSAQDDDLDGFGASDLDGFDAFGAFRAAAGAAAGVEKATALAIVLLVIEHGAAPFDDPEVVSLCRALDGDARESLLASLDEYFGDFYDTASLELNALRALLGKAGARGDALLWRSAWGADGDDPSYLMEQLARFDDDDVIELWIDVVFGLLVFGIACLVSAAARRAYRAAAPEDARPAARPCPAPKARGARQADDEHKPHKPQSRTKPPHHAKPAAANGAAKDAAATLANPQGKSSSAARRERRKKTQRGTKPLAANADADAADDASAEPAPVEEPPTQESPTPTAAPLTAAPGDGPSSWILVDEAEPAVDDADARRNGADDDADALLVDPLLALGAEARAAAHGEATRLDQAFARGDADSAELPDHADKALSSSGPVARRAEASPAGAARGLPSAPPGRADRADVTRQAPADSLWNAAAAPWEQRDSPRRPLDGLALDGLVPPRPASPDSSVAASIKVLPLPRTVDEAALRAAFERYGGVVGARVFRDADPPHGYVDFADRSAAVAAAFDAHGRDDLFFENERVACIVRERAVHANDSRSLLRSKRDTRAHRTDSFP